MSWRSSTESMPLACVRADSHPDLLGSQVGGLTPETRSSGRERYLPAWCLSLCRPTAAGGELSGRAGHLRRRGGGVRPRPPRLRRVRPGDAPESTFIDMLPRR
jgi:hypothetical protein